MKVDELIKAMPKGCHIAVVDPNDELLAEAEKPLRSSGVIFQGAEEVKQRDVVTILIVDTDHMLVLASISKGNMEGSTSA